MIHVDQDRTLLNRLVGCWAGTVLYRASADHPFAHAPGTSENRWVLGGRFVEMTLRTGLATDSWSAVLYFGYERSARGQVLVSLEPDDRRVKWVGDSNRLLLVSGRSRATCDLMTPGELKLELAEETPSGHSFVRFRGEYRPANAAAIGSPLLRQPRRFVIA